MHQPHSPLRFPVPRHTLPLLNQLRNPRLWWVEHPLNNWLAAVHDGPDVVCLDDELMPRLRVQILDPFDRPVEPSMYFDAASTVLVVPNTYGVRVYALPSENGEAPLLWEQKHMPWEEAHTRWGQETRTRTGTGSACALDRHARLWWVRRDEPERGEPERQSVVISDAYPGLTLAEAPIEQPACFFRPFVHPRFDAALLAGAAIASLQTTPKGSHQAQN